MPRNPQTVKQGKRLGYLSIVIALVEAALAIPTGIAAGSIALLGFGLDSLIEVGSAAAVLWGLAGQEDEQRERREKTSLQVVGALLLALAVYIAYESIHNIVGHEPAHRTIFGIAVLAASLGVMLWLRRAKREVAARLGSHALVADSKQTEFCAYLSAIALAGLGLNALFGLWWADPAAAIVMVPIIVREGIEAVQGKACIHN
ncbi:MAG TPA: cation transporter [Candidatus Eremiobacteraceae bacterium]|nr:cation transporter [Candidatus Eremiobacteraceae bacterium]